MYNHAQEYTEAIHRLEAVSFTRAQGEVIMAIIEERQQAAVANLATKRDIDELRQATKQDIETLQRDIRDVRKDIEVHRAETQLAIEKVRHEVSDLRSSMRFYFLAIAILTLLAPSATSLVQLVITAFK
ncbi:hypothetical protein [Cardiobacterium hominis]|uniref:hypothetical protein n=1 Tax=Cardiobacterium hominis TaxID=2718 RepID=UPI0028D30F52|nr:hypothetical protein [Cardiobacterium hominis]